jgi:nodulation protein E
MRQALADAQIAPEQITHINAHGTGTHANDAAEAEAIHRVFPQSIPVTSTKAAHGHSIGATGAIEALATLLALDRRQSPITAGVTHSDETLAIDLVTSTPRDLEGEYALSNSLAFGGLNAVLCLRRYP